MGDTDQLRQVAWDVYASALLGMSYHPGTTRDKPNRMTVSEVAAIADAMLAERDRRFGPKPVNFTDPDFIEYHLREVRHFYGENSASDDVVKLCAQAADEMDRMLDDVSELAERFDAACMERNKALAERDEARRKLENTNG